MSHGLRGLCGAFTPLFVDNADIANDIVANKIVANEIVGGTL